ncbi:hypothetical protein F0562_019893 [Nyssa sinensis]|uniref:Uncharacterized protein n=1 Tax=Nyssa sinensis TaxID=561372 RepID=A0A5J5BQF1_9ASTE|nr:hypothetical protein F0562_019893 [Nyssa sinensis]
MLMSSSSSGSSSPQLRRRSVTKATSEMATTSNVTDPVETTFKENEDPCITSRRGRSKSKDVAASMEVRLERMERAVADIGMQLEDEIPSSATLEAAVEDLRGEALGALNSMADTLRQEFSANSTKCLRSWPRSVRI